MKFIDYVLKNKAVQTRLKGIIDGILSTVFFILACLNFHAVNYPGAGAYAFICVIFQLHALYYFLLAELEERG